MNELYFIYVCFNSYRGKCDQSHLNCRLAYVIMLSAAIGQGISHDQYGQSKWSLEQAEN